MKVLLWQMHGISDFDTIVLWDGHATYWNDDMRPSFDYSDPSFIGASSAIGRWTYIGELE